MITKSYENVVRLAVVDVADRVAPDTRLAEAVTLRRCALQRKAFRGVAVGYPADSLRLDAVASWVKRHGVAVDVASTEDLEWAVLAGIDPTRVVMHCAGEASHAIRRAVETGVARFTVDRAEQVAVLADSSPTVRKHVLVDAGWSDELAAEVTAHRRLDLIGLHYRLDDNETTELAEIVDSMIARMAVVSRKHGVVLSRLSLADVDATGYDGDPRSLRRFAERIDQAVEDGCIRWRFPRPALAVSPRPWVLQPV